ncbi:urokinase plasminogen activator surface receptor-like isoform X1 [Chiloscyllium plagiosum]|uniref:urokinase plasminogen activator surface receptor-like isoform X1 n=1 Tax=Chiloscyllium plagiosum TaxID=36176 RepID=UPI001CB87942|nr:urokinase plasminogen activator surface receptor-like isoform X1 [Chiloscyllium plagiosum]XP_043541394.1 urokinase plasminogen activator surface receptor-like isoform X1 [Chiloscyllium plagiosum]XP_043541395.1 urokinase plasminogen activator surface receptor-like isoform X1 [Chiloscyllium plagiosum]
MKVFFSIVLVCAGITAGRSLQCFTCSASSGSCSLRENTCLSGITNCQTVSSHTIIDSGTKTLRHIEQRCENPSEDVSLSTGRVFISRSSRLCGSDRCNDQTVAEPANTTLNGLQCFGCFSPSMASCLANRQTVKCVGLENRCVNGTGQQRLLSDIGPDVVFKGCASANQCGGRMDLQTLGLLLSDLSCCEGSLCNGDTGITTTVDPGKGDTGSVGGTQ